MISSVTRAFSRLAPRQQLFLFAAMLFALSAAQYAYTIGNPFIWDSKLFIAQDLSIRDLGNIPSYFIAAYQPPVSPESVGIVQLDYYRPVLKTLYALEWAAFGPAPAPYHAVNVTLNAAVVVAFFFLVRAICGDRTLAFAAALLYATNPARGEAVYSVYGSSSVVMALFALLALLAYHRRRHVLALAAFAVSLLSRESAVLFPLILLLYEWLVRDGETRRRFLNVLPYVVLTLIYLGLRTAAVGGLPPVTEMPPLTFLNTSAVIIQRLLKILVVPDAPVTVYPLELFPDFGPEVLLSYAVTGLAAAALVGLWIWRRPLVFWYLWFFAWIALTFNLGRFADYLMAEKYLYLAMGGLCVVAAAFVPRGRFGTVLLGLVVAAHFTVTFARSTYWRDEVTYFEQAVAFAPDFVAPRYHLALAYATRRDYAAAASQFEGVLERDPNHSLAVNNLGNTYYMLGDRARASAMWKRGLKIDPSNALPAYNLGMLAEDAGDIAAALGYYRHYLAIAGRVPPRIAARIRRLEAKSRSGLRAE